MLQYRDGKYFATQVRMLLNSGHVRACVVGPPDETAGLSYPGVTPLVVGDKDSFAECVAMLGDVRTLREGIFVDNDLWRGVGSRVSQWSRLSLE